MATTSIFVVRTTVTGEAGARARYSESGRGYRIVQVPEVGDVVLDVLTVNRYTELLEVSSAAVWAAAGQGESKKLVLASTWNWGDQYETGAEFSGRDAVLSALFYPPEDSNHPGVARCGQPLLSPLTWGLADADEPAPGVYGEFWAPAVVPA